MPLADGSRRRRENLLLAFILAVAGILRAADLNGQPPGINCDEAAYGVGAASIGSTGRTIHGDLLPLFYHERTFEHWGNPSIVYQPIQLYATVPFVWMFGKTAAAVRGPSVCFALLGILGAALLAREMFGGGVALGTAALLTISPWHLHLSRIGIEAMSLSAFLAWGAFFLWRGRSRRGWLIAGAATLALATYAYPPGRLFAPLLALAFAVIHRKTLWERRADLALAAAVALLIVLPNVFAILHRANQGRMYGIMIFNAQPESEPTIRLLQERAGHGGVWRFLYEHPPLRHLYLFGSNWWAYNSPSFLFWNGSRSLHYGDAGPGVALLACAPLIVIGLVDRLRSWRDERSRFLLAWLLLWSVPASLTTEAPHLARGVTNFPVLEILAAIGLAVLADRTRPLLHRTSPAPRASMLAGAAVMALGLGALGQGALFAGRTFGSYRAAAAGYWDYGIRESFDLVRRTSASDEQVVLSHSIMNGYLFALFFEDVNFGALDPTVPDFAGLLPPKYLVSHPGRPGPRNPGFLWLIRAHERADFPGCRVVGEVPYPGGAPNLFLIRPAGP
jgi:4-amino-4-deoxy-L-arabinose transferase-like glycosyltransferase